MSGQLHVRSVVTQKNLSDFVSVPQRIYGEELSYIPQLNFERMEHLGSKNPYFSHAKYQFFVAYQGEDAVGRISAQIDEAAQKENADRIGHFGFVDARDDVVLKALLEAAEGWLSAEGAAVMHGPYSLSINDEAGLLVEGFDDAPFMMMNYAPQWVGGAMEAFGYKRAKDLLAFHMRVNDALPQGVVRMGNKALEHPGVKIRCLDKAQIERDLGVVLEIFNEAWAENWGFVAMNQDEITYSAKNMKPLIKPELVQIAEIDGKAAAMIVALPDLNEALDGLDGSLWPLGWMKLLWRLKVRPMRRARVLLMGVQPEYQSGFLGSALASALIVQLYDALKAGGYHEAELSWILDDNTAMIRLLESAGGRSYKRYRIYEKDIT